MALEITHLCAERVEGLLDGALPFTIHQDDSRLTARIAGWSTVRHGKRTRSEPSMRSAAYEMLARYREDQRPARP